ncbi:MAG: hypothetical protein V4642_08875, partial [Bacteroidota bacterium]
AINRPERYSDKDRLDTEAIARKARRNGKAAYAVPNNHGKGAQWGELASEFLLKTVKSGDVIVLLSNGDFGDLRDILPVELEKSVGSTVS